MANLDVQLEGFTQRYYHRTPHVGHATSLIDGLLARHSVTAAEADIALAERLVDELVVRAPSDSGVLLVAAIVHAALHRFAAADQALERALAAGAPAALVSEVRADLFEARGDIAAALALRIEAHAVVRSAQGLSRVACCQLALKRETEAQGTFDAAVAAYRSASPLPLSSMLFNWGHTWQHRGDYERAQRAYRSVLGYLPGHVGANRALATCGLASGDNGLAIFAARCAADLNPDDPISVGLLGLSRRHAGLDDYERHLARAHRLFQTRMTAHPEAWAAHAGEFWLAEGGHPADAARAARVTASVKRSADTPLSTLSVG